MASSPGAPDPRARLLALLPPDLAGRSLSPHDLAFTLADAELVVSHLAASGQRVTAWDSWVLWPSGARARSLAHPGSFALPLDPARAADAARDGMRRAGAAWDRKPEYPGATLYFTIEVAS